VAPTERRALPRYLWTVAALAAPLVYLFARQALTDDQLDARTGIAIAIFSAVLIIGEMWPIPVARGQEAGETPVPGSRSRSSPPS